MKSFQLFVFLLLASQAKSQMRDSLISIYFTTNSYQVNIKDKHVLKNLINRNTRILSINGFADSIGQTKNNFILIGNRLKSIIAILKEMNIDLQATSIINGGEEVLKDADLSLSRRVDIKIGFETSAKIDAYDENSYSKERIENEIKRFNSLANFQFEPDKAILTFDSYQYLDDLYDILKTNNLTFEIVGHVNYQSKRGQASLKDIYELSTKRAKVIYDLLLEKGILAERMTYRGVGNSQPVFRDPKNEEEKRKNMRVEIIVKKK